MAVIFLTFFGGALGSGFRCQYSACISSTRIGRVSFGCFVKCFRNGAPLFSTECEETYVESTWDEIMGSRQDDQYRAIVKVALRYYAEGYVARALMAKRIGISSGSYRHLFEGSFECWKRTKHNDTGGQIEVKMDETHLYRYKVDVNDGLPTVVNWSSLKTEASFLSTLRESSVYDGFFLVYGCPLMVRRGYDDVRRSLPYREGGRFSCGGRYLLSNWYLMWRNWTKYSEITALGDGKYVIGSFINDYDSEFTQRAKKRSSVGSGTAGILVLVGGGFMMLLMLCGMSAKRRHDIARDLKRRRDSFRLSDRRPQ